MSKLYAPMAAWYHDPARGALRQQHGAFPSTPDALVYWRSFEAVTTAFVDDQKRRRRSEPAALVPEGDQIVNVDAPPGTLGLVFKRDSTVLAKVLETSPLRNKVQVGWTLVSVDGEDVEMLNGWQTSRLLQAQAAAGRKLAFAAPARAADQPGPLGRVAAALSVSPRGRSGAAVPVVAGDVVAEFMEREAPAAGEPGEAVGSVEFLGLWNRENKKHSRVMPLKMEGGIWYGDTYDYDLEVRVALGRLVDKLVRNKARSGLLAIGNWTKMVSHRTGEGNFERTVRYTERFWAISWSARPDDERYQQLGLISMQAPLDDIRFAGFDGAIGPGGSWGNAVYRVTLPREGFDPWKWVSRPPPPAPAKLYTGPRDDGLLSTGEISGAYGGCYIWGCESMTVVPLGADVIETWSSNLSWVPPFFSGPRIGGNVWTRKQHTNEFVQLPIRFGLGGYGSQSMTCSADGIDTHDGRLWSKRPDSQKRAFRKVETKDLAGTWCDCFGMIYIFGLCCNRKKALNEDQYEESGGLGCCMFLPVCYTKYGEPVCCNEPNIRTRQYVNGHPTNAFDQYYQESYRDPSYAAWGPGMGQCTIAKKIG